MNREIKYWADWARSQGWTVRDDSRGYTHFHDPEGRHVGRYPATPSTTQEGRVRVMWVATLTYALDLTEAELDRLADELEDLDAGLANIPDVGVDVTYWTDADGVLSAAHIALEHVNGVMPGEPVGVDVVDHATYERRADAPTLPRLVSAPEVAEMLGGVSRQRVHQLRVQAEFPAPLFELRTGPIWDARAIERFARAWSRKPGRPAKTAS